MTAFAYYNERDPYAAEWIRNLISAGHVSPGDVDQRDIRDVRPDDLRGYTRCHFFAGVAGWDRGLQLAGWPTEQQVWTGSCPCQPFSAAGRRGGFTDERHLWPIWADLIRKCRPPVVFGEQVAGTDGLGWFDAVSSDLEAADYACGASVIPAYAVGAPHKRERIWFVAHPAGDGREGVQQRPEAQVQKDRALEALGPWNRPGDPFSDWRKLLAGAEVRRLDDGVSSYVAVRPALRAYGNAIVPEVAAAFIGAAMEASETPIRGALS